MLDDALAGSRASNGGRGIGSSDIGSNDGGRPFGGGRGRHIDVSTLNLYPKSITTRNFFALPHP
jgi:hypothetical protein